MNRALIVHGYNSEKEFYDDEENDMGGNIDLYISRNPSHEQLISQAELALVYLTGDLLGVS